MATPCPCRVTAPTAQVAMVTDRKLYRVGDTVYLKGYGRTPGRGSDAQALTSAGSVSVVWGDTQTETKDVTFDDGMHHVSDTMRTISVRIEVDLIGQPRTCIWCVISYIATADTGAC